MAEISCSEDLTCSQQQIRAARFAPSCFRGRTQRTKDGKTHEYWSVVENERVAGGRIVQRHALYLGEINSSQAGVWRKAIEVLDDDGGHLRKMALFAEDRCAAVASDATVVCSCVVVLSIDEKSQIQAFDGTQPGLPMKTGRYGTITHDYIRHGTATMFAARYVLDGSVIGRCMQQHRYEEFIRFLNTIEAAVPAGKLIHAIADNYATHKHPKVRAWLARHPRWTFYFTPTSASWLNAAEGFFTTLTKRRLKPGVFRSIVELQAAINRFLAEHNHDPTPFRWTKSPKKIIAAVKRRFQVLDSIH